jgi:hypothetical protein
MFCIKNVSSALDLTEKEYITMIRLCQLIRHLNNFCPNNSRYSGQIRRAMLSIPRMDRSVSHHRHRFPIGPM